MDFYTFLWTTFGVFVTLATFSFLYKDNPFYKFAEHLVVGVSAGYFIIILWHNSLVPNLFQKLADGDWYYFWLNSSQLWYLIPAILGVLMWTRFSKDYAWVSRWPMALYIGISTGIAIPLEMANRVNKQLYAMMADIDWSNFFGTNGFDLLDVNSGLSQVIIFIGASAALIYFFFSKEHTGLFGKVATFGLWTLMISFGASFGFTVMARISLFINRIQDVGVWGEAAWDSTNPNYGAGFQIVFWLMIAFVVGYIINELRLFARSKSKAS
ncbi:MAG: hypothetical protein U9N55_01815 [candidate division Zixibacteria bacterium]|nr:hypothetical protein [candidate division Zixibacteria bacterium]